MTYEVELKFPLDDADRIVSRLEELNVQRGAAIRQSDVYFSHPQRDFAETDEALRIRAAGPNHKLTYKGPLLDDQTKTRREIELTIGEGEDGDKLRELLEALGFRPLATVQKQRVPFELEWEGRALQLALDDVDGLGEFLEIEIVVDGDQLEDARQSILRLAGRLGLENSQRKSYLCLLLEKGGCGGPLKNEQ